MTAELPLLAGQLLTIAFASGLNLYATVAALGIASRVLGAGTLPVGLLGLENGIVIASAATLFLVESVVDKVRHVDSVWDAIHTPIRPIAAALLVFAATAGAPLAIQATAAALAGACALAAHATKAGLRLAINTRPGQPAGTAISFAEDGIAVAFAIVALASPPAANGTAALASLTCTLAGPPLWRAFALGIRALAARIRGFFGTPRWKEMHELPPALRPLLERPGLGEPAHRATRAAIHAQRPTGTHRNGWLVITHDGPCLLYRSLLGARRITLPRSRDLHVRTGPWADTIEIRSERFPYTLLLLKDGPSAHVICGDLVEPAENGTKPHPMG